MKTGLLKITFPFFFSFIVSIGVDASEKSSGGNFTGLFFQPDAVENDRSGYVSLKLTPQASFSGYLLLAGKRLPFASSFESVSSSTEVSIPRAGTTPLTVVLSLANADSLQGYVSDGSWTVPLSAERLVWDKKSAPASDHTGQYTTSIDKSTDVAKPNGYGYGTVTVDVGGTVKLIGALGDGTKVTQIATVSKTGLWPLYVSGYGGKGSALGWISLNNATNSIAFVDWTKDPVLGPLYPDGFKISTRLFCSPYHPPTPGNRVMQVSEGYVVLEGGPLTASFVNELSLSSQNKVTNLGDYKLSMKFVPKTGLFTGTISEPGTGTKLKFSGIVFQTDDLAVGTFIARSRSGSIVIAGDRP